MPLRHTLKPSLLKRFVEFLRKDYDRNEFTIGIARYVGFWAHPLYYIIWTAILPQPYESFELRFASLATFVPLLFCKYYPANFKPWVNLYWYFWLTFTLPVIFTFLTLMNNFSGMWLICETMMLLVFIIFIPNYYMLTLLLVGGIAIAYTGYVFTTGSHLVLTTEIVTYLLPLPMALMLGLLSGFTIKHGELAQERNRVLKSLAGSIAHEMRNPLGQIRHCLNSIQNLLPRFHPERPENTLDRKELESLYQRVSHGQMAVKRGIQVVDMVLDEIQEKPIGPDSFTYLSAGRITRKALDEYGYESERERERIHLDAKESFLIRVNETFFIFVIFNLLKNALFYFKSHPNSRITIKLKKGREKNILLFRDTGPGISRDDLPHIFDSFHTRGKRDGTGLGLTYCKRVMKAFGGDIACTSVLGEFTEFKLTFPLLGPKALKDHNERILAKALPDFQGKRLLVVDDEQLYRTTLRHYLTPLDAEIDEAADGREALKMVSENRYDLILMDLQMPLMSGYEATEKIRRGEAGLDARSTPVIAHSAESSSVARTLTEQSGMQALIAKPCSQSELVSALRSALHTIPDGETGNARLAERRALLVDDSALNRDLLAMNLSDAGLDVTVAENGNESWVILQKQDFDLLVTDIHMPDMDGLQLTRRLRQSKDPRLRRLPVIGLSGSAEEEDAAKAAGMDAFRLKTDSPKLLLGSIAKLLNPHCTEQRETAQPTPVPLTSYDLSPPERERLIRAFIEECHTVPAEMLKALAEGEAERLREQAHKLKGSAALFGAETLRQAAEALERSCRFGWTDNLDRQIEQVSAEMERLQRDTL